MNNNNDELNLFLTDLGYNLNKVLYKDNTTSNEDLTRIQNITKQEIKKKRQFEINKIVRNLMNHKK
jgi:hypothetical protein